MRLHVAAAFVVATIAATSCGAENRSAELVREAATTTSSTSTSSSSTTTSTTVATTTTAAASAAPRPTVPRTTSSTAPATGLQGVVNAAVARRPVPVSVAALDLRTGERGEHLGTRVVLSASLYKLFVARELFRRIAEGSVSRTQPSGDGNHTVDECLRLMIIVSDDGCGVAGMRMVGGGDMDPALHRDGFGGTYLASPQRTTAADVTELFRRERAGDTELYGLLRQQQVNDRIPPALPPGTPVAHKTGDRTHWAHDAGVITTPKGEVIVSVLTGPWPSPCCHEENIGSLERQAFALIGEVARRVYDYSSVAS